MPAAGVEALNEIVRAIALAAAERDDRFAETFGTHLRAALGGGIEPSKFDDLYIWLTAFEARAAGQEKVAG